VLNYLLIDYRKWTGCVVRRNIFTMCLWEAQIFISSDSRGRDRDL